MEQYKNLCNNLLFDLVVHFTFLLSSASFVCRCSAQHLTATTMRCSLITSTQNTTQSNDQVKLRCVEQYSSKKNAYNI